MSQLTLPLVQCSAMSSHNIRVPSYMPLEAASRAPLCCHYVGLSVTRRQLPCTSTLMTAVAPPPASLITDDADVACMGDEMDMRGLREIVSAIDERGVRETVSPALGCTCTTLRPPTAVLCMLALCMRTCAHGNPQRRQA